MPAIRGYNLDGILLGEISCPPRFDSETSILNPSFQDRMSKDQLLLHLILNSVTHVVTSQILKVASSSAHEVWKAIANLCGAQNRSRVQVCRTAILTANKGTKTMTQYLQFLKENVDNMAVAGAPMSEIDLITSALVGLDTEYMTYSAILQERPSLTWPEMYASLISFKARLQQMHNVTVSLGNVSITPSANAAYVRPTNGFNKDVAGMYKNQGRGNGNRGSYNGGRGNKGKGKCGRFNSNNRPVCQICKKVGHEASICYYITDLAYGTNNPHHAHVNHSFLNSVPSQFTQQIRTPPPPNALFAAGSSF
ncbi:hypothetical protein Scep_025432 [Stephania cephalantha]|uniref:Gag protein n=1 Tax=Stephania cephalantha TaxID=152367 RepID=A0AAP0ENU1_9MAGN